MIRPATHTKRKIGIYVFSVVLLLMIAWSITASKRWKRLTSAVVTRNGTAASSMVFRAPDGSLLLSMNEQQAEWWYVIHPTSQKVLSGGRFNFIVLPMFAYDKRGDYGVDMNSPKMEKDPKLIVQPKYIEFDSFFGSRVRASW